MPRRSQGLTAIGLPWPDRQSDALGSLCFKAALEKKLSELGRVPGDTGLGPRLGPHLPRSRFGRERHWRTKKRRIETSSRAGRRFSGSSAFGAGLGSSASARIWSSHQTAAWSVSSWPFGLPPGDFHSIVTPWRSPILKPLRRKLREVCKVWCRVGERSETHQSRLGRALGGFRQAHPPYQNRLDRPCLASGANRGLHLREPSDHPH